MISHAQSGICGPVRRRAPAGDHAVAGEALPLPLPGLTMTRPAVVRRED